MSAIQQMIMAAYGAAVWTPATLFAASEQGVWYDPSDFSTLFQDAAGTTPVTAVGQPVGRILDKSGRGNHATQATTTKRPVLQQDGAGKYYLAFDGVDDALATASINFTATDKMTVFAGVRNLTTAPQIVVELSTNAGTSAGAFYLVAGNDSGFFAYSSLAHGSAAASQLQVAGTSSGVAPDTAVLAITHDIAGDLSTLRRNTVAGTDGTGDKGTGNFGNYPLYIGARNDAEARFNGRLYSLIVRGAASTADQITAAETWINSKTGAY